MQASQRYYDDLSRRKRPGLIEQATSTIIVKPIKRRTIFDANFLSWRNNADIVYLIDKVMNDTIENAINGCHDNGSGTQWIGTSIGSFEKGKYTNIGICFENATLNY